jgi:hypothetical protein
LFWLPLVLELPGPVPLPLPSAFSALLLNSDPPGASWSPFPNPLLPFGFFGFFGSSTGGVTVGGVTVGGVTVGGVTVGGVTVGGVTVGGVTVVGVTVGGVTVGGVGAGPEFLSLSFLSLLGTKGAAGLNKDQKPPVAGATACGCGASMIGGASPPATEDVANKAKAAVVSRILFMVFPA